MDSGRTIFSQLTDLFPNREFRKCVYFAQVLIKQAGALYKDAHFGMEPDTRVYASGASCVDLCMSLFAWATFRGTKKAVKLHTLLDLRGNFPMCCRVDNPSL